VVLSQTGSDHLHVIAEEVSRVAELCIGQDMGTMSTAMAFTEMEAESELTDSALVPTSTVTAFTRELVNKWRYSRRLVITADLNVVPCLIGLF
jgi:hypothetical protein